MQRRRGQTGLQQGSVVGTVDTIALEEALRAEQDEVLDSEVVQQPGDTLNALINSRWVSMAILMFIVSALARAPVLMAMSGFMLIVVFAAWLWSRSTLINIAYTRRFHHTHAFPGETTEVEITVENRKWLPVTWLQIDDEWPGAFRPTNDKVTARSDGDPNIGYLINAYSLRWYERIRRRFELKAEQRGVYELGPVNLVSGDPFSLFERMYQNDDRRQYLVIYPAVKTLEELGLPLHEPFGDRRVQRRLFEDPNRIMGVRDYQPQDSFRTIHWKATARTGELQTKIFEPTRGTSLVLAVNIASFEHYWYGYWPAMLEYTLSVTASIAKWAFDQDYAVGLACNGAVARSDQPFRLAPSRRYDQLQKILEMLAGVRFYVTAEFGRYILNESPRLPLGATFVLVTPFVDDMIAQASLRLRDSGRRVNWVVLGKDKPQEVQGIRLHHIPIQEEMEDVAVPDDMVLTASHAGQRAGDDFEMPTTETPRQRYLREQAEAEARRAGDTDGSPDKAPPNPRQRFLRQRAQDEAHRAQQLNTPPSSDGHQPGSSLDSEQDGPS